VFPEDKRGRPHKGAPLSTGKKSDSVPWTRCLKERLVGRVSFQKPPLGMVDEEKEGARVKVPCQLYVSHSLPTVMQLVPGWIEWALPKLPEKPRVRIKESHSS